jgi:hypothetical protein
MQLQATYCKKKKLASKSSSYLTVLIRDHEKAFSPYPPGTKVSGSGLKSAKADCF